MISEASFLLFCIHLKKKDNRYTFLSVLDNVYDDLTQRILNLANLNPTELRVVYLLKIGVQPADMATILCKSKSAISMIRTRMYEKIFGKSGTAPALDEYIQNF